MGSTMLFDAWILVSLFGLLLKSSDLRFKINTLKELLKNQRELENK